MVKPISLQLASLLIAHTDCSLKDSKSYLSSKHSIQICMYTQFETIVKLHILYKIEEENKRTNLLVIIQQRFSYYGDGFSPSTSVRDTATHILATYLHFSIMFRTFLLQQTIELSSFPSNAFKADKNNNNIQMDLMGENEKQKVLCACRLESQWHPGLHQKRCGQQGEGHDGSPLLCPLRLYLEYCVQAWSSKNGSRRGS